MTRPIVPIHRFITSRSFIELVSELCLDMREIGSVMAMRKSLVPAMSWRALNCHFKLAYGRLGLQRLAKDIKTLAERFPDGNQGMCFQ